MMCSPSMCRTSWSLERLIFACCAALMLLLLGSEQDASTAHDRIRTVLTATLGAQEDESGRFEYSPRKRTRESELQHFGESGSVNGGPNSTKDGDVLSSTRVALLDSSDGEPPIVKGFRPSDIPSASSQHISAEQFVYDKPRHPIVVNLGLPKTGTKSLFDMLNMIKYPRVTHYTCKPRVGKKIKGDLDFQERRFKNKYRVGGSCGASSMCALNVYSSVDSGFRPFDLTQGKAFTQLDCLTHDYFFAPQIAHLHRMTRDYRADQIVFVMTTRSDQDWVSSVNRWGDLKQRLIAAMASKPLGKRTDDRVPSVPLAELSREEAENAWLVMFKQWHENRVRNLTRGFHLTELNLSDEAGLMRNFTSLTTGVLGAPIPASNHYIKRGHRDEPFTKERGRGFDKG